MQLTAPLGRPSRRDTSPPRLVKHSRLLCRHGRAIWWNATVRDCSCLPRRRVLARHLSCLPGGRRPRFRDVASSRIRNCLHRMAGPLLKPARYALLTLPCELSARTSLSCISCDASPLRRISIACSFDTSDSTALGGVRDPRGWLSSSQVELHHGFFGSHSDSKQIREKQQVMVGMSLTIEHRTTNTNVKMMSPTQRLRAE